MTLRSATYLQGFALRAMDGEIGKVDQFYLDDETWAIRYLATPAVGWRAGWCLFRPSPSARRIGNQNNLR